jgi:hypothetical protein
MINTHSVNKLDKFNDEMVGKGLKNKKLISTKNI